MSDKITRELQDEALNDVIKALGTQDSGVSDMSNVSVEKVVALAATMNTPLVARLNRREGSVAITHSWLDQGLGAGGDNAQAEGTDAGESSANKPTRASNTMQIQQRKIGITDSMRRVARAGGLRTTNNELGRQVELQMQLLMKDQEYSAINGVESTADPRHMKGLLNWVPAGNTLDGAAIQITADNVEDYLNDMLALVVAAEGGAFPNALYCGAAFLRPLGKAASNRVHVEIAPSDMAGGKLPRLTAGQAIGYFMSDFGILEIVYTPYLTIARTSAAAATSRVLALFEDAVEFIDYFGSSGVTVEPRAKTDSKEYQAITQELTLEYRFATSHALLKNFYV